VSWAASNHKGAFSSLARIHVSKTSATARFTTASIASEATTGDDGSKLFEPLGVGIKRDYAARLPLLKSDVKDGLNVQVRASSQPTSC
jgi:hypothetical protein